MEQKELAELWEKAAYLLADYDTTRDEEMPEDWDDFSEAETQKMDAIDNKLWASLDVLAEALGIQHEEWLTPEAILDCAETKLRQMQREVAVSNSGKSR